MSPQNAPASRLPDAATFAGILAALAAPPAEPAPAGEEAAPGWLTELNDDVSLLSYEQALKAHRRCRPGDAAGSRPLPLPSADPVSAPHPASPPAREAGPDPSRPNRRAGEGDDRRKRASVTLRMSRAECAQLQQRAAEAGLTVSAYLRSCAFEVDALRTQVKQALAELHAAQQTAQQPASQPRRWWTRLFRRPMP